MQTYYIQAEILSVNNHGEVDVDTDVYEMKAESPEQALEFLRELMNFRNEFGARGVHQAEVLGYMD